MTRVCPENDPQLHAFPVDEGSGPIAAESMGFYAAIAYGLPTIRLVKPRPLDPTPLPFQNHHQNQTGLNNKSATWDANNNGDTRCACTHAHSRASSASSGEGASDTESLFSCESCEVCFFAVFPRLLCRPFNPCSQPRQPANHVSTESFIIYQ